MSGEKFSLRSWVRQGSRAGGAGAAVVEAVTAGRLAALPELLAEREDGRAAAAWLNQCSAPGEVAALEVAVTTPGRAMFVGPLVAAGARADQVGGASGLAPLHLAAQTGDPHLLALLLADPGADSNVRAADRHGAWTPLHFAAKGTEAGHLACAELLVGREEVEVDVRDVRAVQTPLALAALEGREGTVRLLLSHGADPDLRCGRRTVREYLAESLPHLDLAAVPVVRRKEVMQGMEDRLLTMVRDTKRLSSTAAADLGAFTSLARCLRPGRCEDRELGEVLALAAERGLADHVRLLLRRGAGPNSAQQPLLEAAARGDQAVLAALLDDPRTDLAAVRPLTSETILHLVLRMGEEGSGAAGYRACLALLLEGRREAMAALVNRRDSLGNTALHLATQRWPEAAVTALLELGANIGVRNHRALGEEIPIARIRPQVGGGRLMV